uniref:Uncharacterized protein n=1 Tax=Heterorhabditis bacteriophora TaxID=37862 RepID=A0A1I7WLV4_HETBA
MSELFATRSFKCFSVAAYEVISRINVILNNYLCGFHIVLICLIYIMFIKYDFQVILSFYSDSLG